MVPLSNSEHGTAPSRIPTAACSPYRVRLRCAVQFYHVALQVLLLHELLGAGGALKDSRGGSAPSCPPTATSARGEERHRASTTGRGALFRHRIPGEATRSAWVWCLPAARSSSQIGNDPQGAAADQARRFGCPTPQRLAPLPPHPRLAVSVGMLEAGTADLVRHVPRVRHHVQPQLHPPLEHLLAH